MDYILGAVVLVLAILVVFGRDSRSSVIGQRLMRDHFRD